MRRETFTLFGILVGFVALGVHLIYFQSQRAEKFRTLSEDQQGGRSIIPARRGMIFDRCGRTVALSRQTADVFVDPSLIEDVEGVGAALAARTNQPAAAVIERIRSRKNARFVVVAEDVDPITAQAVEAMGLRSVGLTNRSKRNYPLGSSMAHALGWVGRDGKGLGGIELSFEHELHGTDGRCATIHDVRRRSIRRSDGPTVAPVDGSDVVLTLDAEIQRIAEDALAEGVKNFEAESGVAVVMSPKNGNILAMACWPTFDPNEPATAATLALRRNRIFTDPVEPGSTFKPIVASGALDGGFVTTQEKIDCHMGVHYFGSRRVVDTKPQGMLDLRGIVVKSSNIGMATLGVRMGNEALYATLRRFGFGERTGVGGRAESTGVVYPLKRWNSYSTTSIPFGYEVLVTPIQLARAFATLLNDGILVQPRLVRAVIRPDGTREEFASQDVGHRRAASSASARFMAKDALIAVVEDGGGHRAQSDYYRVLGKTGTAKLINSEKGVYEDGSYLSLFMGAAPASDPSVLTLVMIRHPNASIGYYGGVVAAPVAGAILEQTLIYEKVPSGKTATLAGL